MKTLHFGIEMEMTGITRNRAASLMARFFGTESRHEGGAYDTYTAKGRSGTEMESHERLQPDSAEKSERRNHGCFHELPHGSGQPHPFLRRHSQAAGTGADAPQGRGLRQQVLRHPHPCRGGTVHGEDPAESGEHHGEQGRHDLPGSPDQPLTGKPVLPENEHHVLKGPQPEKPDTMDGIADLWYQEAPYGRNHHYNSTRYHGLNLHATFTKGTVEFRLFNGTLHAGEIKAYIQFCLAVAHQALTQKKASARKTETDNEKYAFRCWMLRLGLIGDEFKTCRLHFLKHLTGNSAWRNAAA